MLDPAPQRVQRLCPGTLDHAVHEARPRVDLGLRQLQPEQSLDESRRLVGFDASAAHRLADHRRGPEEAGPDRVDNPVDVPLDAPDERVDHWQHCPLIVGPDRGEHDVGIGEHVLQPSEPHRIVGGDVAELLGEAFGVGAEGRRMLGEQLRQPGADMGRGQHRLVRHLVQTNPQPQVVGRKAPLGTERVDRGRHHHHVGAGRAGDR